MFGKPRRNGGSCGKLQARCGKAKADRGLKRADACEKPRRCKPLGHMARRNVWCYRNPVPIEALAPCTEFDAAITSARHEVKSQAV